MGTQEAYSAGYEVGFRDGIGSAEKSLVRGLVRDIAKADGARAAVDLIRKRLATEGHDPGCDGSHQWCDPDALPPGPRVWDIIDEVLTELAGEEYKAA